MLADSLQCPADPTKTFITKFKDNVSDTAMSKQCSKCGLVKPLSEFGTASPNKDGYNSWCKQCCRDSSKNHRESVHGIYALIKGRQRYYKKHDMNKQKPLVISKKDFVEWYENEPKFCIYCGIKEEDLGKVDDPFMNKYKRLTVDCKDNDVGYIKGNLVLCCRRCNTLKIDFFTYEEFKEIGRRFVAKRWEKYLNPRSVTK